MPYVHIFFFNDTATTDIYTLSLHDALPICADGGSRPHVDPGRDGCRRARRHLPAGGHAFRRHHYDPRDRKSTRLNSSHANISYAVFCLKIKTIIIPHLLISDTPWKNMCSLT